MSALQTSIHSAIQFNNSIADDILTICKEPLFERFKEQKIAGFGYVKLFKTGKWLCVSNDKAWVEHFFTQASLNTNFQKDILNEINQDAAYLSSMNDALDLNIPIYAAAYEFSLWHGFNIYNRQKDWVEYCYFHGTKESQNLVNFYLNNIGHVDIHFSHKKIEAR